MRKLIKKILKESNDLDWIKDINVDIDMEYLHGYYFRWLGDLYLPNGENVEIRVDRKFWIDDITKNRVYYSWDERGERLSNSLPIDDMHNRFKSREYILYDNNDNKVDPKDITWFNEGNNNEIGPKDITESSDDLQWIRDIEVEGFQPKKGDYIEIINLGSEKAFVLWLGDFKYDYLDGYYGNTIKGVVAEKEKDYNYFELIEENTKTDINFPNVRIMSELENSIEYKGLKLMYKLLKPL